jgi:hypothetical protein
VGICEREIQVTPAAKITYSLTLIVGLCIGVSFGFWNAALNFKAYYDARRTTAPVALDHFAIMQYRHADADHAKSALLSSAGFLETLQTFSPDRGEQLMLANTYIRIALLEDSANNSQASGDYMAKARYLYKASGGHNYSDAEMKSALIAADERLQQVGIQ